MLNVKVRLSAIIKFIKRNDCFLVIYGYSKHFWRIKKNCDFRCDWLESFLVAFSDQYIVYFSSSLSLIKCQNQALCSRELYYFVVISKQTFLFNVTVPHFEMRLQPTFTTNITSSISRMLQIKHLCVLRATF